MRGEADGGPWQMIGGGIGKVGCAGCAVLAQSSHEQGRRTMRVSTFARRVSHVVRMARLVLAGTLGLALGAASPAAGADEQGGPEESAAVTASPPPADQSPFGEKYYPAIAPTQRRLLRSQLDRAGLADPLEEARIR